MADLLLVDDDTDLAGVLGEYLSASGHQVRLARDGQQALALLEEHLPDLVLLDVEMPVLTGPEVSYRMLVHDAGQERIPIVLLSGVVNLAEVAALVGTPYFLAKPFDIDAVLSVVSRALAERTAPHPSLREGLARPE